MAKATQRQPALATPEEKCGRCSGPVHATLRHCPSCAQDLGFPNVRAARDPKESSALALRYEQALTAAKAKGTGALVEAFERAVAAESHVVVAMGMLQARSFLTDAHALYAGYEGLVGSGLRTPALPGYDADRCAVGGKLFGSFAERIRYGALSLDGRGLTSYGAVFLKLRDIAVSERTSFFYENSFLFFADLGTEILGTIPLGYRSDWEGRGRLAVSKLASAFLPASDANAWAVLLMRQGADRKADRCIEAHIYDGFTSASIEQVRFARAPAAKDRQDVKVIRELAAKKGISVVAA